MYEKERGFNPEHTAIYDQDTRYKDAQAQRTIAGAWMEREEFEPKVRKRMTIDEQIDFNHQRLCELEKHFDMLRDRLGPVLVDNNTLGIGAQIERDNGGATPVEQPSMLMAKLQDTADKINWLIELVKRTDSRVQL
jgi:hypothetical protein